MKYFSRKIGKMNLAIIRQDITKLRVVAIVNSSNTNLLMHSGVSEAIFKASGIKELKAACDKLAPIEIGNAVITPGFNLPAKYVIHTAPPAYDNGKHGEDALIRLCYINSLRVAKENGCTSVSFPLISSEIYGYPKDEVIDIAITTLEGVLNAFDLNVFLVLALTDIFSGNEKYIKYIDLSYDDAYINVDTIY